MMAFSNLANVSDRSGGSGRSGLSKLASPRFIIGLGNPGPEFAQTRHNAGFAVVDALAAELGVSYWKLAANALVAETNYGGEKLVLVKPQSYMNLSGGPVKGLTGRYGFTAEDLLVIHDELDLPAGVIRLKRGGGHAGHNGLRSLHQSVGPAYARLRIGIGRPPGRMPAHAYVLQRMGGEVLDDFAVTVAGAVPIVRAVLDHGLSQAMNVYNRSESEGEGGGESADRAGGDGRAGGENRGTGRCDVRTGADVGESGESADRTGGGTGGEDRAGGGGRDTGDDRHVASRGSEDNQSESEDTYGLQDTQPLRTGR